MIIDAHIHCTGQEDADDVVQALDEADIDVGVLLAPFLSPGYSLDDPASLRRGHAHLGRLVRAHPDRLVGLAVVDPRSPDAAQDLRRAREVEGLAGVKLVPTGWYPYDEAVQPVFATACELDMPVLCHSGIFIDGRSGRYCRPAFFEALRAHPGLRVTLAHLGWPWTDEAIAVGLIDLINGVPQDQVAFRFDISFGPPPAYRLDVLRKALDVLGPGLLQFGSDCFLPCPGAHLAERRQWVVELMAQLGLDAAAQERIWSGTAAAWLGRHCPAPRPPDGRNRTRARRASLFTGWPRGEQPGSQDSTDSASSAGRPLRFVPRCC
ncbi:MAG: amidohydrolase family protein [Aquabacterium sp.]